MANYTSQYPQTNISIFDYYSRLAYKYRNWLSEFNKYEVIIPVTNLADGTQVPSHLINNQSIKFIRIITS